MHLHGYIVRMQMLTCSAIWMQGRHVKHFELRHEAQITQNVHLEHAAEQIWTRSYHRGCSLSGQTLAGSWSFVPHGFACRGSAA